MFIRPRVLSILTTRRCTAACDHCCVGASPRAKDAIPIERIHGLIDEAKRIPAIERIVFTGGECFLLGKDLDALIAHAHELELQTRVVSNGYWAVNQRAASLRVRSLSNAGLDEIMLSAGTFHQQFVPLQNVVSAARATASAKIPTLISVEACDQSDFCEERLSVELTDEIAAGRVRISAAPWIPDAGGRGKGVLTHEQSRSKSPTMNGPCNQIMNVVAVTPKQELIACCGFPMEELPALRIGSVAESPIDDVLRRAPPDLLKIWLHTEGPAGIAEFVARYVPGYTLPAYASICQACTYLQRDETATKTIAAHLHEALQAATERLMDVDPPAGHPFSLVAHVHRSEQ